MKKGWVEKNAALVEALNNHFYNRGARLAKYEAAWYADKDSDEETKQKNIAQITDIIINQVK